MRLWLTRASLTFFAVFLSCNSNALTIDTTGSWDGIASTCCFGEGSADTYGQTFTVSQNTFLNSFSFWIDDRTEVNKPIDLSGYLIEWHDATWIGDYSHPVGSLLYQGSMITTTNNHGAGGMEKFTFDAGAIQLDQGKKYAAFISSALFYDGVNSSGSVGSLGNCCDGSGDVYGGGEFVLVSYGSAFSQYLTQTGWGKYPQDLAFVANFSSPVDNNPISEPSTYIMLLSGLGFLGFAGRHKKRNRFPVV